jgi:asparagine synthase (glutamine-hydrolysing)
VLLAGNGGDEMFLGYPTYEATRMVRALNGAAGLLGFLAPLARTLRPSDDYLTLGEKARRFTEGCRYGAELAHVAWRHVFTPDEMSRLLVFGRGPSSAASVYQPQLRHYDKARELGYSGLAVESWGDLKGWVVDQGLSMWDKAGMRWSTEIRVPFLDPGLVDLLCSVPIEVRGRKPGTKTFLRTMYREDLPKEVLSLPKHGFQAPVGNWLRGPLRDAFRDLTSSLPSTLFSESAIAKLWGDFEHRRADNALRLWTLGCLAGWSNAHTVLW